MKTVNMHEAKTHLSKLVAGAVRGEPFVIARAGRPAVKVTAVEEARNTRMLGLFGSLAGAATSSEIDAYFDPAFEREIAKLFHKEDPLLAETVDQRAEAQKRDGTD